jgi:hypothetical protein
MEKSEIIKNICELTNDWTRGNVSIIQLFLSSGYKDAPDKITTQDIESHLRQFPKLIDSWKQYSWDNHGDPAWYLNSHGNSTDYNSKDWYVGYSLGNKIYEFSNAYEACAFYIKQTMDSLRVYAL